MRRSARCLIAALTFSAPVGLNAACTAPVCTKIIDNGPDAGKRILAVLGDGYAAADQTKFNTDVGNFITDGVFGHDFFREDQNAFNVYRLNLVSTDSGVSQVRYDEKGTPDDASDDTVTSRTDKNTALGYVYSGSWAHCWLEWSNTTGGALQSALAANVPNYNYTVVILNEDGWGGCGGGGLQQTTRAGDWTVMAHEYGHGIGGLADEYSRSGAYSGGAWACPMNCSTDINRSTTCWRRFINSATAIPTPTGGSIDHNRTVGLFTGCSTKSTGIYRPVDNCRMRSNSPLYCPVCYTIMKKALYSAVGHNFADITAGDFNGDGRSDVLVHNGQDLAMYLTTASNTLNLAWTANNIVPAASGGITWQPMAGDQYFVADFDGDGKDDVYVFNGSNWIMPYLGMLHSDGAGLQGVRRYDGSIPGFWQLKPGDHFYSGDFDGDKRADLFIANGANWSMAYLGLLKSQSNALSGVVRYDGSFPGWAMRPSDEYTVGDFDGDGKIDLYVFNGKDWSYRYLGMARSTGAALSNVHLFTSSLPGWSMTAGDQRIVGDFDGDGKDDLFVFNGTNWAYPYLLMAHSTGGDLAFVHRYDNSSSAANIPGWQMTKGDHFWLSDANGDGKADLFVYNPATNWSTEYLGTLQSSGTALSGSWSADWVGGWNLGGVDKLLVARYDGAPGRRDIFIRNNEWFGLLRRASGSFVMDRIYYHWIYTPLYDAKPWSDSMP